MHKLPEWLDLEAIAQAADRLHVLTGGYGASEKDRTLVSKLNEILAYAKMAQTGGGT